MRIEWTDEEVRLDLALRTFSTLLLALLLITLGPGDLRLTQWDNLEAIRRGLGIDQGHDTFHRMRVGYVLDFLFLFGLGYLLRATILSRAHYWRLENPGKVLNAWWYVWGPRLCLAYMLSDVAENLAALGILSQVLTEKSSVAGFGALRAFELLKFVLAAGSFGAAAAAWRETSPDPESRRKRILRRVIVAALGVAAALTPALAWWTKPGIVVFASSGIAFLAQNVWLGETRYVLRLLFFLRVPVLSKLTVALLAPLALSPLRAFLAPAYYFEDKVNGWVGFVGCTMVSCLLAFALSAHAGLILERGGKRFDVPEMEERQWFWVRAWFQYSALAAALLTPLAGLASSYPPFSQAFFRGLGLLAAGILAALMVTASADFLRAWLSTESVKQLYLILPGKIDRGYQLLVRGLARRRPPQVLEGLFAGLLWFLGLFRPLLGPGYYNRHGVMYPDQGFALLYFGAIGLIFAGLMWFGLRADQAPVPTLTSILFLILFLSSGLGALAFYLDRYRVPLLAGLGVVLGLSVMAVRDTDHSFELRASRRTEYRTPAEILAGRERPFLVAASGGGIQAAAWVTRVAEGLGEEAGLDFRRRTLLFSTVSGGSVGALFLGAQWKGDWHAASLRSRESSLGAVSWAFAGPDLFRPVAAALGLQAWDRGYALEKTLRKRLEQDDAGSTLDQWAHKAGEDFPAFLLNATVAETGGPVAFATTQLPSERFLAEHPNPLTKAKRHVVESWRRFAAQNCRGLERDVSVATAARLSATFPYVSPAARPDVSGCNFHFVDGGYYDNYGIIALLQWLDDALESMEAARWPKRVGIVVVRGLYEPATAEKDPWSYLRQVSAPLESFLNMRGYAQWEGGMAALRLFREKWAMKAPGMSVEVARLAYPDLRKSHRECAEEPLTWKLTETQKNCVDSAFSELTKDAEYQKVLHWR